MMILQYLNHYKCFSIQKNLKKTLIFKKNCDNVEYQCNIVLTHLMMT